MGTPALFSNISMCGKPCCLRLWALVVIPAIVRVLWTLKEAVV